MCPRNSWAHPETIDFSTMRPSQENPPKQRYERDEWDEQIELVDTSQLGLDEPADSSKLPDISPYPFQMPLEFNECVLHAHNWAVFRCTPTILYEFSRFRYALRQHARGRQEVVIPSLWAYYETLPEWCREHDLLRSLLMAFEVTRG